MTDHTLEKVLAVFEELNTIPRCSKKEAGVSRWARNWAQAHGWTHASDAAGNLVIRVPGSPGRESAPTVILQGHMDMVCEKTPESLHDFERDPIRCIREGEWMRADQTTLGADNGVALALAMVLAEDESLMHPPLELLFTVDEETGLTGASKLDPAIVTGKLLINIDSEDEGVFTIGCAGGEETLIRLPLEYENAAGALRFGRLRVGGLRGGHSGIDIKQHRANANRLLVRVLQRLTGIAGLRVAELSGGSAHNAIPRDALALVAFPATQGEVVAQAVSAFKAILEGEHKACEPSLQLTLAPAAQEDAPSRVWTPASAARAIDLLLALPHGVMGMSTQVEGLVETSCNLAIVRAKEGWLEITSSQRSSVMSRLDELTARVQAAASLAGAATERLNRYPAWRPDTQSALLHRCQAVYRRLFEKEPVVEVIHAGLECGLIGAKVPGMDMISVGPTMRNPHSPDERLHMPSVAQLYRFLAEFLADFT